MCVTATAKRRRRQLRLTSKAKKWSTNAAKRYADAKQGLMSTTKKKR